MSEQKILSMNLADLKKPFPEADIEWRVGRAGYQRDGKSIYCIPLAYITNRAIMERLDAVCGPENWKNEFRDWHNGSQLCGISIRIGDEWITKWDGANSTEIEPIKGGLSDAMKRAAVQWGIGRYLYEIGEQWANCFDKKPDNVISRRGSFKKNKDTTIYFWYAVPELPPDALPDDEKGKPKSPAAKPKKTPPKKSEKTDYIAKATAAIDAADCDERLEAIKRDTVHELVARALITDEQGMDLNQLIEARRTQLQQMAGAK